MRIEKGQHLWYIRDKEDKIIHVAATKPQAIMAMREMQWKEAKKRLAEESKE